MGVGGFEAQAPLQGDLPSGSRMSRPSSFVNGKHGKKTDQKHTKSSTSTNSHQIFPSRTPQVCLFASLYWHSSQSVPILSKHNPLGPPDSVSLTSPSGGRLPPAQLTAVGLLAELPAMRQVSLFGHHLTMAFASSPNGTRTYRSRKTNTSYEREIQGMSPIYSYFYV